jgi:hypothetical protein
MYFGDALLRNPINGNGPAAGGFCLRFRDLLPVRLATHYFARQPLVA